MKFVIFIILLIFLIVSLFSLEQKMIISVEKGSDPSNPFRISTESFEKNPHSELKRYINDTLFFANIWRTAMLCSSIICVMLYLSLIACGIDLNPLIIFPFMWLVIFCICYHTIHFKYHHHFYFIANSVKDALDHIERTPNAEKAVKIYLNKNKKKYKQICYNEKLKFNNPN